jgi:hypothetical protein
MNGATFRMGHENATLTANWKINIDENVIIGNGWIADGVNIANIGQSKVTIERRPNGFYIDWPNVPTDWSNSRHVLYCAVQITGLPANTKLQFKMTEVEGNCTDESRDGLKGRLQPYDPGSATGTFYFGRKNYKEKDKIPMPRSGYGRVGDVVTTATTSKTGHLNLYAGGRGAVRFVISDVRKV